MPHIILLITVADPGGPRGPPVTPNSRVKVRNGNERELPVDLYAWTFAREPRVVNIYSWSIMSCNYINRHIW